MQFVSSKLCGLYTICFDIGFSSFHVLLGPCEQDRLCYIFWYFDFDWSLLNEHQLLFLSSLSKSLNLRLNTWFCCLLTDPSSSDYWEICWLFSQLIDDYFNDSFYFYFSAIYQRITEKCLLLFIQFTIMQDKEKQKILTFERTEREILLPFCLKMTRIINWLSKHWLYFLSIN